MDEYNKEWIKENYTKYTKLELCNILNINIRKLRKIAKEVGVLNMDKSISLSKRNKLTGRDLSLDKLKEIASKYKTRGQFQLSDPSAYTVARSNGYLNEICSHMTLLKYSIPQLVLLEFLKSML